MCEIKFKKTEIQKDIIKEVQRKMDVLTIPKGYSIRPILIHANGVSSHVISEQFFAQIIVFSDLIESPVSENKENWVG